MKSKKLITMLMALALLLCACAEILPEQINPAESTAAPELSRSMTDKESEADRLLGAMTLEEKVCQMFIVRPEAITGVTTAIRAGDATKSAIEKYPVGGIIYGADNLLDAEQTKTMIANTVSYSKTAPFISVDEEGGNVARVAQKLGTTRFEPMYHYKDRGASTAEYIYRTIAGDISEFGFNLDFAPDADVWTNPDNRVIGTRAFSDDPNQAAEMVGAAVKGLQDNGICAAIKHFPGHGNTEGDSHTGLVYSNRTLDELKTCEFLPFQAGIEAGADFVMVGHIIVPSVDEAPATLSSAWVTDILRGELGYDGLIITDGMEMGAIAANYTSVDAAVKAVKAGCDVILEPDTFTEAYQGLLNAVNSGEISEERINDSARRILTCKLKRGIIG